MINLLGTLTPQICSEIYGMIHI